MKRDSDKKHQKRSGKSDRPSSQQDRRGEDRRRGDDRRRRAEEPGSEGGGGFVFRDRSGQVHAIGGGHKQSLPKEAQPERGFEPAAAASHSDEYFRTEERVHRPERAAKPGRAPRPESEVVARRNKFNAPADKGRGRGKKGKTRGEPQLIRLRASIDKNRKGFGFLSFENRQYEDAFVPPREAERFFHGDRVEVTISTAGEVHDIKVLEHRFKELTGRFVPHPNRGGWIVYERRKSREEVYVPELGEHRPDEGDWVRSKLVFHEKGQHNVTAEILEVYGPELPPAADVTMIANEYNLVEEHPAEAEREAREVRLEIPGRDMEGRTDLRDVPLITIDGETARDFDDAVYVEPAQGGYVLWVAIADVSHYVKEGTALDDSARSRGTSVYFPERAFHMLPRALSENLCSLRPDEPRLSMVARMEYDKNGKRQRTEIMEAVIQSKRRATYNQIQAEWEANRDNPDWEYRPHFELYQIIRRTRTLRGSIDFDLPEAEVRVEKTGEVISIKNRARMDAHRLIEEFMIAANEAVTEWMMARAWPFVYRVHDVPAIQALEKFQTLAANVGVNFAIGDASPKVMAELVEHLAGHPAQDLLNMALLRSMKQAVYSSLHGIHFGLASEGYTHFTSPIRRYPDLVVHRLLRWALKVEKGLERPLGERERQKLEEELTDICEHCSYRERLAADAERDSNRLKGVRLMQKHLGDEFEGKVNGMTENGLFIQLVDPFVEGMVPKDSLEDDFYRFDEEHMVFFGTRKKRTFRMGDPVKVRVARADIDERKVDFELLEGGTFGRLHPAIERGGGEGKKDRGGKGRGFGQSQGRGGERREERGGGQGRGRRRGPKQQEKRGGAWGGPQPQQPSRDDRRGASPAGRVEQGAWKRGDQPKRGSWSSDGGGMGLGRADQRGGGGRDYDEGAPRSRKGKRDRKGKRRGRR